MLKNPPAGAGDIRGMGLTPRSGRSPEEGNANPLWYCLENLMDSEAWQAMVHRVEKSQTRLKQLKTHS